MFRVVLPVHDARAAKAGAAAATESPAAKTIRAEPAGKITGVVRIVLAAATRTESAESAAVRPTSRLLMTSLGACGSLTVIRPLAMPRSFLCG
jgi:hypothetical protein